MGCSPGETVFHERDHAAEDAVYFVEIPVDVLEGVAFHRLHTGEAEIEIDMGVHAQEEVLQDKRKPVGRGLEGKLPGSSRRPAGAPILVGADVVIGEVHVQALHARAVFEFAASDAGRDLFVTR